MTTNATLARKVQARSSPRLTRQGFIPWVVTIGGHRIAVRDWGPSLVGKCPRCGAEVLINGSAGIYACAACDFDGQLDEVALYQWRRLTHSPEVVDQYAIPKQDADLWECGQNFVTREEPAGDFERSETFWAFRKRLIDNSVYWQRLGRLRRRQS